MEQKKDIIDSHREKIKKAYPAYFDTYSDTIIVSATAADSAPLQYIAYRTAVFSPRFLLMA